MTPIPWSIWPFPGSPFILPQFLEYQYLAMDDSFRAKVVIFPVQLGGEIVPSRIVRSMLGGTRRSVAFVSSGWPSVPGQAIVLPSATLLSAKMFHRNGDCRHFAELHLEIESGKVLLWRSMNEGTLALLREHNRGFASGDGGHSWPTCSDIRVLRRAFGPMRLVKSDSRDACFCSRLDEYDLEAT